MNRIMNRNIIKSVNCEGLKWVVYCVWNKSVWTVIVCNICLRHLTDPSIIVGLHFEYDWTRWLGLTTVIPENLKQSRDFGTEVCQSRDPRIDFWYLKYSIYTVMSIYRLHHSYSVYLRPNGLNGWWWVTLKSGAMSPKKIRRQLGDRKLALWLSQKVQGHRARLGSGPVFV